MYYAHSGTKAADIRNYRQTCLFCNDQSPGQMVTHRVDSDAFSHFEQHFKW